LTNIEQKERPRRDENTAEIGSAYILSAINTNVKKVCSYKSSRLYKPDSLAIVEHQFSAHETK